MCNKIDYTVYQKKRETGKEVDSDEINLDLEAAERAWPNFKVVFETFQDYPTLGPSSVIDSTIVGPPTTATCSAQEPKLEPFSPNNTSMCSSRSSTVNLDSEDGEEGEERETLENPKPPPKKKPAKESRVPKKEKASVRFLLHYANIQAGTQKLMMEHESRMQTENMAFQVVS